ncbi:DUF1992 domain-containing protein [Planctomicrobium sp. SH664]|uniref:DnaJ family domain-containing protein n=1 Tax=Planctomicrobium sp. SH664 TaxID=3448125 RepID=UPI003F5B0C6B
MAERKPGNLSWAGFAEQQIQAAEAAGEFTNLPGMGQPIPGIDQPLEENWWLKQKLKSEHASVLPPLLEARQLIEKARHEVLLHRSESVVRARLEELRQRVDEALRSPLPSPPVVVLPVDIEEEVQRWKESVKRPASERIDS